MNLYILLPKVNEICLIYVLTFYNIILEVFFRHSFPVSVRYRIRGVCLIAHSAVPLEIISYYFIVLILKGLIW